MFNQYLYQNPIEKKKKEIIHLSNLKNPSHPSDSLFKAWNTSPKLFRALPTYLIKILNPPPRPRSTHNAPHHHHHHHHSAISQLTLLITKPLKNKKKHPRRRRSRNSRCLPSSKKGKIFRTLRAETVSDDLVLTRTRTLPFSRTSSTEFEIAADVF